MRRWTGLRPSRTSGSARDDDDAHGVVHERGLHLLLDGHRDADPGREGGPDGGVAGVRAVAMAVRWCPCGGRETYQGARCKSRPARSPTVACGRRGGSPRPRTRARRKSSTLARWWASLHLRQRLPGIRRSDRARGHVRSTDGAYISVQKEAESASETRPPRFFFLRHFWGGPKMFRLLQCACIAEQHWVSTEANT